MPGVQTFPTQQEIDSEEQKLKNELRSRAQKQMSEVSGSGDVHIRDILPSEDLDQDDTDNDNGWNGTDREWVQTSMSGGQLNQVYEIDSNNNAESKIIGIFAFSNTAGNPITSEIVFRDGTGSTFERAQVEEVFHRAEDGVALLEQPIIFNVNEDATIHQWSTSDGSDEVVYHGAVAEKKGRTLGERSVPQGSPVQGRRQA